MLNRTPGDPLASVLPQPGSVSDASGALAAFHSRMGKEGDPVIAEAAGVKRHTVAAYRKRHGIPAYEGHLFKEGSATPTEGAPPRAVRARAPRRAPPAPPPRPAGAPARTVISPRGSKMDPFVHLVGVLTDGEVAKLAGVTSTGVRLFRRRHRIPVAPATAHSPRRSVAEKGTASPQAVPVPPAPAAPVPPGAPVLSGLAVPVRPPSIVSTASPAASAWRTAFRVEAVKGDQCRRIIVVAGTIQDALARAVSGLGEGPFGEGGAWSVRAIKAVGAGVA